MNYGSGETRAGSRPSCLRKIHLPSELTMPTITPTSTAEFLNLIRESGIYSSAQFEEQLAAIPELPPDPIRAAEVLVRKRLLTTFQAKQLTAGRNKGFRLGAYVIQDLL